MTDVFEDKTDLRQQVSQLQGALDSRVVIERAAGMLRERLGLPVKTAFELLRTSARSSRLRLQPLAEEVVGSFATPSAIVRTLARSPQIFRVMSREERVVQTVEFFGEVNDGIAASAVGDNEVAFLCECANPYCTVTVELSVDDIKALHSKSGYYVILPGHEIPDLQDVVQRRDGYSIIKTPRA